MDLDKLLAESSQLTAHAPVLIERDLNHLVSAAEVPVKIAPKQDLLVESLASHRQKILTHLKDKFTRSLRDNWTQSKKRLSSHLPSLTGEVRLGKDISCSFFSPYFQI